MNAWFDAVVKIARHELAEVNREACPHCKTTGLLDFQYVATGQERMGYLDVWCTSCNHGVHFSRVKVPSGYDFIEMKGPDSEVVKRIPNYIPDSLR